MHASRSAHHGHKRDLTFDLRISLVSKRPNIKPITQENAPARLKQIPRLLFRICGDSAWRDRSNSRLHEPKRLQCLSAIQQNTSIRSDPFAAEAPQYLEIICD